MLDVVLHLVQDLGLVQDQATRSRPRRTVTFLMKIMKFDLKRIHMVRYELILRLDEALWLRIIFQPLLTPKRLMDGPKISKEFP